MKSAVLNSWRSEGQLAEADHRTIFARSIARRAGFHQGATAPSLAEFMQSWRMETPYLQPADWVFPSTKLTGGQPRVADKAEPC